MSTYAANSEADPWPKQSYGPSGPLATLESDLIIKELPGSNATEFYVVGNYLEGCGQIYRDFDSLHLTEMDALARVTELESVVSSGPRVALVQRVREGVLLSDASENQPKL